MRGPGRSSTVAPRSPQTGKGWGSRYEYNVGPLSTPITTSVNRPGHPQRFIRAGGSIDPMGKVLGIMTEDFRLYHDLVAGLKARDIPFVSLSFSRRIPEDVGVIVTSPKE